MNLEKTLLLFDWDAVVCDTARFKQEWSTAIEQLGIPMATIQETYQAAKEGDGYTMSAHQDLLIGSYPELADKIKQTMSTYLNRTPAYIFADAKELIITAGLKGAQTGILSAGSKAYQLLRMENSGLQNQFNFITIVPYGNRATNKAKEFEQILARYERVIFFEDDTSVLEEVAAKHLNDPKLTLVYVNRDGIVRHVPNHTVVTAALDSATISKLCFEG